MAPQVTSLRIFVAAVTLGPLFAGGAEAADRPSRAPAVQAVVDCRTLPDDQRLACYDRAVDKVVEAEKVGDLVTIDRAQRRAVRRQAFGLSLPALAVFGPGGKGENLSEIATTITSVSRNATGRWVLTVEDGAVWTQTDDIELYPDPRPGTMVTIKEAALGSFFMTVNHGLAIRVHRQN